MFEGQKYIEAHSQTEQLNDTVTLCLNEYQTAQQAVLDKHVVLNEIVRIKSI